MKLIQEKPLMKECVIYYYIIENSDWCISSHGGKFEFKGSVYERQISMVQW